MPEENETIIKEQEVTRTYLDEPEIVNLQERSQKQLLDLTKDEEALGELLRDLIKHKRQILEEIDYIKTTFWNRVHEKYPDIKRETMYQMGRDEKGLWIQEVNFAPRPTGMEDHLKHSK